MVKQGILERLAQGPVLGDGGYLLELEKRGYVQAGPFTPEVVIEHPDALAQLHREFLRGGVDVLQTMTFYASDDKLATVGMQGKVDDINRNAVQVARQVAAEGDALVAGNLSLTWAYDPNDPASADHVRGLFDRQLQDQTDAGGVDFWIGETFSFVGEALLFVERAKRTGLPVMATMCFEQALPRSYEGDTPAECARKLVDAGTDIVGVNCLNGPEQQLRIAIEMRGAVSTSRTRSTLSSCRGKTWLGMRGRRWTPGSTTSDRAAAPSRRTCERWPRCWARCPSRNVSGSHRRARSCPPMSTATTRRPRSERDSSRARIVRSTRRWYRHRLGR